MLIAVDPALFAFRASVDEQDLERRLSAIFLIDKIEKDFSSWLQVSCSATLAATLYEHGLYPAGDELSAAITKLQLREYYSANDLMRAVGQAVQLISIEDITGINAVVLSQFNFSQPILRNLDAPAQIAIANERQDAVAKLLLYSAKTEAHPAATLIANDASTEQGVLTADLIDATVEPDCPITVAGYLRACQSRAQIIALRAARDHWRYATTEEEIKVAIEARCGEMRPEEDFPEFVVGPYFLGSLGHCDASEDGRFSGTVLDKCARVLVSPHSLDVHAFSDAATDKSLRADGSRRMRAHVTKCKEALRLHFWQGSTVEFVNVDRKNQLDFPN
jgi:hypothetical protein